MAFKNTKSKNINISKLDYPHAEQIIFVLDVRRGEPQNEVISERSEETKHWCVQAEELHIERNSYRQVL